MKKDKILKLLSQGKTIKEIAKEAKCTKRYVKKIMAGQPKEEPKPPEDPKIQEKEPEQPKEEPKKEPNQAQEFIVDTSGSEDFKFSDNEIKKEEEKQPATLQKTRENISNLVALFYCSAINALAEKEVVKNTERKLIQESTLAVCNFYVTEETNDKHVAVGLFMMALVGVGAAHWNDIRPGIERLQGKTAKREKKEELPERMQEPQEEPQHMPVHQDNPYDIDRSKLNIPLPPGG